MVGLKVGSSVLNPSPFHFFVGEEVGSSVSIGAINDGDAVGFLVGRCPSPFHPFVGDTVGSSVGYSVGDNVGSSVTIIATGEEVGSSDVLIVGLKVGLKVGLNEGDNVG